MKDVVRQIDKAIDVLDQVRSMLWFEAQMNAAKHMSGTVRPVPLYAAVDSEIGDLQAWREREGGE